MSPVFCFIITQLLWSLDGSCISPGVKKTHGVSMENQSTKWTSSFCLLYSVGMQEIQNLTEKEECPVSQIRSFLPLLRNSEYKQRWNVCGFFENWSACANHSLRQLRNEHWERNPQSAVTMPSQCLILNVVDHRRYQKTKLPFTTRMY